MRIYLDTSAMVKLVVSEDESAALLRYLGGFPDDTVFSAALARTELLRAVSGSGQPAITQARALLDSIDLVTLTRRLLDDAGVLAPPALRSLDAVHLAAAQRAAGTLRSVVTYDHRMAAAAAELGMATAAPD
jgi:predicted nucleic acid-binding protein